MYTHDVIIIGGGAAGLSAAVACYERGITNILIIEREAYLGGILNQCIHDGFGVEKFQCSLTGPEYAQRYIEQVRRHNISVLLHSMVLEVTPEKRVVVVNRTGVHDYQANAIILAMGCRERSRGAIGIPGTRPAGLYTAGVAQHFINLKNYMVGQRIVILGSGDIGLIMARRLTLEGAEVALVAEKLPYSNGLPRNVNQCLYDFDIPLLLNHTVIDIHGQERVSAVTLAEVGPRGGIVRNSRHKVACDTLLLSVGLIPENELSRRAGVQLDEQTGGPLVDERGQTTVPGIFACGNVLHVHDLVDWASLEAEYIVAGVAEYLQTTPSPAVPCNIPVKAVSGLRYVLPHVLHQRQSTTFSCRVLEPSRKKTLIFTDGQNIIAQKTFARVNPAEMIRMRLTPAQLESVQRIEVGIAI